MFKAALCASCHTFKAEGGNSGPDLTQLGTRYTPRDILQAILQPSEVISEQYQNSVVLLNDGSSMSGRIMDTKDDFIFLAANPFDMSQTQKIRLDAIKSVKPSKHSPMPPALINALNPQELADLIEFLKGN